MIGIKIILFIPLLALLFLVFKSFKNHALSRLVMIGILLVGILFVLYPSLSNQLAHLVGVGRGADLVIYLFIIFSFIFGAYLYAKFRKLKEEQAELIKKIAVENAKDFKKDNNSTN
jgi:hypothetical protein